VQHEQWMIMFPYKNSDIESHLRTAVGEIKPIADVLQKVTPENLLNMKTDFISTMLNKERVYFDDLPTIIDLMQQMSTAECKQFKLSIINGIGPSWTSVGLKKNSSWIKKINAIVTTRRTRT
jgi:hypothetical protein